MDKDYIVLYVGPSIVALHLSDGWLLGIEGRLKVYIQACKEWRLFVRTHGSK